MGQSLELATTGTVLMITMGKQIIASTPETASTGNQHMYARLALLAAKSAVIALLSSQPHGAEIAAVADQTHAAELMIYVIDHSRSLPEIPVI